MQREKYIPDARSNLYEILSSVKQVPTGRVVVCRGIVHVGSTYVIAYRKPVCLYSVSDNNSIEFGIIEP